MIRRVRYKNLCFGSGGEEQYHLHSLVCTALGPVEDSSTPQLVKPFYSAGLRPATLRSLVPRTTGHSLRVAVAGL